VNVAQLSDFQSVERRGQIGYRNFDAVNLIVQTFGGKSVHGADEGSCAGGSSSSLEEIAAAGIARQIQIRRSGRF
jgi:hypothetical protein